MTLLGHISQKDIFEAKGLNTRLTANEQRISNAWFLYSLIEQKGRFRVDGPVSRGEHLSIFKI